MPRRRQERRCCRVSAPRGLAPPGIRPAPGRLVLHRGERKAEFAGHLAEGVFHVRVQQEQGHDPATAACVICCHRAQYTPKSDRTAAARILAYYSGAETSSVLLPCVIGASGAEARDPPIWSAAKPHDCAAVGIQKECSGMGPSRLSRLFSVMKSVQVRPYLGMSVPPGWQRGGGGSHHLTHAGHAELAAAGVPLRAAGVSHAGGEPLPEHARHKISS